MKKDNRNQKGMIFGQISNVFFFAFRKFFPSKIVKEFLRIEKFHRLQSWEIPLQFLTKKIFEMRRKNRWRSVRISYPFGYCCLFSWRLRIWKPFGNILSQKKILESSDLKWFDAWNVLFWRLTIVPKSATSSA